MADHHAAHPAAQTGAGDAREQKIKQLYHSSFGYIQECAMADDRLTLEDGQLILEGVTQHLKDYDGELTQDAFETWVEEVIQPAVQFYGLRRECGPNVRAAIAKVVGYSDKFDDSRAVIEELTQELWVWVLLHLDELSIPGNATLPTRLYKRAQWTARAWLRKQIIRYKAVSRRIAGGGAWGVETLSEAELAAMRADSGESNPQ